MADLVEQCPAEWHKAVRPFLQRAVDFDSKQPLVGYFLRTHAASVANTQPRAPTTMKFLLMLLDRLEAFKAANQQEVNNADGRTVLTRAGLMLFTRADDMERAGQGDETVLKLFFTASQVLEATRQFMPDGKLDPVAEEKVKYAKYIASLIKKSMDSKTPYVSPNGGSAPEGSAAPPAQPQQPPAPATQAPVFLPPSAPPPSAYIPAPAPQQQPPVAYQQPPAPQYQPPPPQQQQFHQPPPPQAYSQPPPQQATPAPAPYQQQPPPPPQQYPSYPSYNPVQASHQASSPSGSTAAQQMDVILEAQKITKQAVAALQFYDTITARRLLLNAVAVLDGQPKTA